MSTIAEIDGVRMSMNPTNSCATCMINCFSCGTGFTGKVKVEGDKLYFVDGLFCFCLRPSPIPCFNGCGYGPLAMSPEFVKVRRLQ